MFVLIGMVCKFMGGGRDLFEEGFLSIPAGRDIPSLCIWALLFTAGDAAFSLCRMSAPHLCCNSVLVWLVLIAI